MWPEVESLAVSLLKFQAYIRSFIVDSQPNYYEEKKNLEALEGVEEMAQEITSPD